ncbi:MAG TPA: PH domain-containing protein [Pirellulaceae bacterium]|nr:PH domain-containing protein [Pirellulaceae bacterium]
MPTENVPREREIVVYYRGRASGVAPMIASFKVCLWIALCLFLYWVLSPDTRQSVQQIAGQGPVAETLQSIEDYEYSKPVAEGIRVCLLLIGLLLVFRIFWIWVGWNATHYTVTNERIQYERGVLAKTIKTIDLWRVRDLIFQRRVIEALLGVGTVVIIANDATTRVSSIGPVRGARRLYDDLMEARSIAIRERGVAAVES